MAIGMKMGTTLTDKFIVLLWFVVIIFSYIWIQFKKEIMKKIILFTFLLLNLNLFAQSKKEIIQTLTTRIDSLKLEITNRDIKFEKEQASSNSNKELMLLNISKLENNILVLNAKIDSTKKNNEQLQENITQLKSKLLVLNDSIVILKKENKLASNLSLSSSDDFKIKIKAAFEKIKNDEYTNNLFDNFSVEQDIIKDSFKEICDDGCASVILTDKVLVMSYRVNGAASMRTYIIDLNTEKDIFSENNSYVYVSGFDKEKSVLKIETDGLDNIGRYFKSGTYNLKTKIFQLGKKEY